MICYKLNFSGRSSAWIERLVRDQEAGGSNPLAPIFVLRSKTKIEQEKIER